MGGAGGGRGETPGSSWTNPADVTTGGEFGVGFSDGDVGPPVDNGGAVSDMFWFGVEGMRTGWPHPNWATLRTAKLVAMSDNASPGLPFVLLKRVGVWRYGEEEDEEVEARNPPVGVVVLVTSGAKSRPMGVATVLLMVPRRERLAEGATLMDLSPPPPPPPLRLLGPRSIWSSGSLPGLEGSEMLSFPWKRAAMLPPSS